MLNSVGTRPHPAQKEKKTMTTLAAFTLSDLTLRLAVTLELLERDALAAGRRVLGADRHHLESGQGMVEYGLILALVAIGVIAVLLLLGTQLQGIFTDVTGSLRGARPTASS